MFNKFEFDNYMRLTTVIDLGRFFCDFVSRALRMILSYHEILEEHGQIDNREAGGGRSSAKSRVFPS